MPRSLKVLIACERSGVVRRSFRALGHEAWSCDLERADDNSEYHIEGDAFSFYALGSPGDWDLVIAHPPCTYLSNSGALRLYAGGKKANGRDCARWDRMAEGAAFFRRFFDAYSGPLCVENHVMHGYALAAINLPEIDRQNVQPWQFGDDASKATVLWLRGLPRLTNDPANHCPPRIVGGLKRWANQTDSGQNKLAPSPDRAARRAQTYPGIAKAMAAQWADHLLSK